MAGVLIGLGSVSLVESRSAKLGRLFSSIAGYKIVRQLASGKTFLPAGRKQRGRA